LVLDLIERASGVMEDRTNNERIRLYLHSFAQSGIPITRNLDFRFTS
jgi:hypothetical protein